MVNSSCLDVDLRREFVCFCPLDECRLTGDGV